MYITQDKVAKILGKKRMEIVEEVYVSNNSSDSFLVEVVLKDGYYFDGYFTTCCTQTFERGYETLADYWNDFKAYFDHWNYDPKVFAKIIQ